MLSFDVFMDKHYRRWKGRFPELQQPRRPQRRQLDHPRSARCWGGFPPRTSRTSEQYSYSAGLPHFAISCAVCFGWLARISLQ
jgi:hypothetical protein